MILHDLDMMLDLDNMEKHETEAEQTWVRCRADMSGMGWHVCMNGLLQGLRIELHWLPGASWL